MKNFKKALSLALAVLTAVLVFAGVPAASAAQKAKDVFISEICFNPSFEENGKKFKTNNDFYEFVEIKNIGTEPIDLTGARIEYSKDGLGGESRYKDPIVFEEGNDKIMEPGEIWVIGVYTILTPRRNVGYSTDEELAEYWNEFNTCYSSSVPVSRRALAVAAESKAETWLPGASSLPNSGKTGALMIIAEKEEQVQPETDTDEPLEPETVKVPYTLAEIEYSPDEYSADGYALQFALSGSTVTVQGSSGCSPMKIYDYQLPDLDNRAAPKGEKFSLTSMNVCYAIGNEPAEGTKDDYTVEKRCARLIGYLGKNPADVICLQEITEEWWNDVMGGLGDSYGWVGESCYGAKDGKSLAVTDSYNLVFYKVSKFELLDYGNFWLLEDEPSVGNKICSWVILRSIETGSAFAVFNTHLSANDPKKSTTEFADYTARDSEIEPLKAKIDSVLSAAAKRFVTKKSAIPYVLCGDFNIDEGTLCYNKLISALGVTDAKYAARKNQLKATYNLWGKKTEDNGMIYDYCFLKNGADAESYRVVTDKGDDGFLISDHFASEIEIYTPSNTFAVNAKPVDPDGNVEKVSFFDRVAEFFRRIIAWFRNLFAQIGEIEPEPVEPIVPVVPDSI